MDEQHDPDRRLSVDITFNLQVSLTDTSWSLVECLSPPHSPAALQTAVEVWTQVKLVTMQSKSDSQSPAHQSNHF